MTQPRTQIDAAIDIVTPENITFRYQLAGPFRRLPAFLIDVMVRGAIMWGVGTVCVLLGIIAGGASITLMLIGWFLVEWFYGGICEAFFNGMTVGKRLMGIRVLSVDGQPINGFQAIMRNVLRSVDMLPPLIPEFMASGEYLERWFLMAPTCMVGLITMALSRRYQRLGDLVCHTMVVIEEKQWFSGVAKLDDARAFQLAAYLPTDLQVSRSLARAIAHYVERRRYFSVPRRREVAKHLGEPLLRQFGLPADTSHDLLLCSMYYRLFVGDRTEDERHVAAAAAAGAKLADLSRLSMSPQARTHPMGNPTPRPTAPAIAPSATAPSAAATDASEGLTIASPDPPPSSPER